tara:strand:- start:5716 stop:6417 length:702 start_codon:yes stop_codon:yes gene_type:complete
MLGTLINTGTVILGSSIGILIKKSLPERIIKTVFQALGVFTLFLGVWMSINLDGEFIIVVVLSLVLGAILGELFLIEQKLNLWLNRFNSSESSEKSFSEGLITAFLLFCIGSMTLLGTFQEGISGNSDLIITKATMDFFSAIALASAYGKSILFSAIPLLIFQGALTISAIYLEPYLDENIQDIIFSTGGIILLGLSLNILEITKIRILNLMPALILAPFIFKLKIYISLVSF